jgi:hypothetical protein
VSILIRNYEGEAQMSPFSAPRLAFPLKESVYADVRRVKNDRRTPFAPSIASIRGLPETFGKTRQELPLRIAGPLLRPVLGEASY